MCEILEFAIQKIRDTHTPALFHVEELTQPQGHSTSGSHERYKSAERLEWERTWDCNTKMREWIIANQLSTNEQLQELELEVKQEVRDGLLVENPEDRGLFTKEQCELINGVPFEDGDQDSIEDLLTLTEQEIKYWEKRGLNPNYIYEMAENGWEKHIDLQIN